MSTPSFLTVDLPCDTALQVTKKKLSQSGLRALQTFDLHTARHAQQDCPCPHHGTADCDCQMVVLMVYGETPDASTLRQAQDNALLSTSPATLILHGSDGQTRFSIADDPSQRIDRRLVASIKEALDIKSAVTV